MRVSYSLTRICFTSKTIPKILLPCSLQIVPWIHHGQIPMRLCKRRSQTFFWDGEKFGCQDNTKSNLTSLMSQHNNWITALHTGTMLNKLNKHDLIDVVLKMHDNWSNQIAFLVKEIKGLNNNFKLLEADIAIVNSMSIVYCHLAIVYWQKKSSRQKGTPRQMASIRNVNAWR